MKIFLKMPSAKARRLAFLLSLGALLPDTFAQDLGITAPPQDGPIAITDVTIHPVSSEPIESGWIRFENGRITGLGGDERSFDAKTQVISAPGKSVYPGIIHAYTQLGLVEISSVSESRDAREFGGYNPEARAIVAVNPDSTLIPVARANGILLAGSFPEGGRVAGWGTVIRTDGWTTEDMAVVPEVGLSIFIPQTRPYRSGADAVRRARESHARQLKELRDFFDDAIAYFKSREVEAEGPADAQFEGLRPLFDAWNGATPTLPVLAIAQNYEQVNTALDLKADYGLEMIIAGGMEAALVSDRLKKENVPVIVLGTNNLPQRDDHPVDQVWSIPSRLERAGVQWCLASIERDGNERNLPYHAGAAVAHGLSQEAALRSITLSAAEVLGIDENYGSLEVGKSATLIVTDGSPLEIVTQVERAFIDGRAIDLENKQTILRDKYREKYRQLDQISHRE